jgi:hypothetical protein
MKYKIFKFLESSTLLSNINCYQIFKLLYVWILILLNIWIADFWSLWNFEIS